MRIHKNNEVEYYVNFTYADLTAMEEFITEKQHEGLQLVGYYGNSMFFRICQPSHSRYCCEAYQAENRPKFDDDYVEFCQEAGWQLVASNMKGIYIFKTDNELIPRIMTDDKVKFLIISKSFMKSTKALFVAYLLLLAFSGFNLAYSFTNVRYDSLDISVKVCQLVVIFNMFLSFASSMLWNCKRKSEIKNGQIMTTNNLKDVNRRYASYLLSLIIMLSVGVVAIFIFTGEYIFPLLMLGVCVLAEFFSLYKLSDNINKDTKKKVALWTIACITSAIAMLAVLNLVLPAGFVESIAIN